MPSRTKNHISVGVHNLPLIFFLIFCNLIIYSFSCIKIVLSFWQLNSTSSKWPTFASAPLKTIRVNVVAKYGSTGKFRTLVLHVHMWYKEEDSSLPTLTTLIPSLRKRILQFSLNTALSIALSPYSVHVVLHVVFLTSFHCDVTTAQPLDGPFDCDVTMKKSAKRCDVGPLGKVNV